METQASDRYQLHRCIVYAQTVMISTKEAVWVQLHPTYPAHDSALRRRLRPWLQCTQSSLVVDSAGQWLTQPLYTTASSCWSRWRPAIHPGILTCIRPPQ